MNADEKAFKVTFFQINKQQTEEIIFISIQQFLLKGVNGSGGKVHTLMVLCVVNEALTSQIMYDEVIVTSCMDGLKNATFRSKYECVVKAEVRSPRSRS